MDRADQSRPSATGTQAIDRGLKLVELVSAGPLNVRDLVERAELPRATVIRLLGALERFRLVAKRDDGAYGLGSRARQLGMDWERQFGVDRAVRPHLDMLVDKLHETGHVVIREGLHAVCVAASESPQSIRLSIALGDVAPLHASANAKVLLAHAPAAVLETILASDLTAHTPRTIVDPVVLEAELAQVRAQGYAESYGELDTGAYALAAPLRNAAGAVVAAIGVSGPTERMLAMSKDRIKTEVMSAAAAASAELGFTELDGPATDPVARAE